MKATSTTQLYSALEWAWPLNERRRYEALRLGLGPRSAGGAHSPTQSRGGYDPKSKARDRHEDRLDRAKQGAVTRTGRSYAPSLVGRRLDTYRGERRLRPDSGVHGRGAAKRRLRAETLRQLREG